MAKSVKRKNTRSKGRKPASVKGKKSKKTGGKLGLFSQRGTGKIKTDFTALNVAHSVSYGKPDVRVGSSKRGKKYAQGSVKNAALAQFDFYSLCLFSIIKCVFNINIKYQLFFRVKCCFILFKFYFSEILKNIFPQLNYKYD